VGAERGGEGVSGCVFCAIVGEEAPAAVVRSTASSLTIVPLSPVTPGHVLVIPRVHVADAAADPEVTAHTMFDAAVYAAEHHEQFNIITSAGEAATQSVFHLHVHVVPRAVDDMLMVPWGTLHGERPQDPHRCRGMVALERQLEAVRA
jgi:histidine triad (HIT) family protein